MFPGRDSRAFLGSSKKIGPHLILIETLQKWPQLYIDISLLALDNYRADWTLAQLTAMKSIVVSLIRAILIERKLDFCFRFAPEGNDTLDLLFGIVNPSYTTLLEA
jgi:hypothetical protein